MLKKVIFVVFYIVLLMSAAADAQQQQQNTSTNKKNKQQTSQLTPPLSKKTNQRLPVSESSKAVSPDPFDKATIENMASQCVKFDTEAGIIEMEMYPESAPESVRSFLNLAATGAFDTTTFSRIVPGFIIQGGDLFTSQKMTPELDKRARRNVKDEPSQIKHERGIVSMARTGEPNSATTNFFILLSDASHLDGTFAAFGRVTKGMEVVDAINKMPVEGEKPAKPVHINKAAVMTCSAEAKPSS